MQINSSYTLKQISEITGGDCFGKTDVQIKNIHFDSRRFAKNNCHLFIAFQTAKNDGHKYLGEVYSSGIKQFLLHKKPKKIESDAGYLIVNDTLKALQIWANHHRQKFDIPVLSITGSYGKTIIKEWIYFLTHRNLKVTRSPKSYNSQFGAALTLLSIKKEHELAIVETGISFPGEMHTMKEMIQPTHVILSNIGYEHLENFSSSEELKLEKEKILPNAQSTYFKNYDNLKFKSRVNKKGREISFNDYRDKETFQISQKDEFSFQNFICCVNFLSQISFSLEEIKKWCSLLPEVALRFEKKIGINNSILINDSYHNNIQSLKIGLENLKLESKKNNTVLILSDPKDLDFDFAELSSLIQSYKIPQLIGIGKNLYRNKKLFLKNHVFYKTVNSFLENFRSLDFENKFILIKGERSAEFQKIALKLTAKKHQTALEINLSNLIRNLNYYRKLVSPKIKILVMIKAAGYGTGLIESAKVLEQNHVNYLGVAYTDEGIELRKNKINTPILVMNVDSTSMEDVIENNLTPSIYSLDQLNQFTNLLINLGIKNYPIHVKINTGMNRLGFDKDQIAILCDFLLSQPEIKVEGIFSHLAASDLEDGQNLTRKQIKEFKDISNTIETNLGITAQKHILNTTGVENYAEHEMDMVRLGIGVYGISKNKNIFTVASLTTRISKIRNIKKGANIGYGLQKFNKDMTIAIIPVGYADGFKRGLGNGIGKVFIKNSFYKTVGNICMDMAFIDISNGDFKVGEKVEIFGENNSIINNAEAVNTIPYEIISSISNRVVRIYHTD